MVAEAVDRGGLSIASGIGEQQTGEDFIDEGGSGREKCLRTGSEERLISSLIHPKGVETGLAQNKSEANRFAC